MDEDFALWNFLEEERERYASSAEADGGGKASAFEDDDDDDELTNDELAERIAEMLGQGITRQGGNY